MTIVAQIEKYRTTHRILGVFAMLTFALSVASILYFTFEGIIVGAALMIAAITFKVLEAKWKAKEKAEFDKGLEEVVDNFLKTNGYQNGSRIEPRSKKRFRYFINIYELVNSYKLEKVIKEYAKETGTRIKFKVRELTIHDLVREIFS